MVYKLAWKCLFLLFAGAAYMLGCTGCSKGEKVVVVSNASDMEYVRPGKLVRIRGDVLGKSGVLAKLPESGIYGNLMLAVRTDLSGWTAKDGQPVTVEGRVVELDPSGLGSAFLLLENCRIK